MYKPVDSFYSMITKNFVWGGLGLLLGIIVNNSVVFLSTLFKIKILLLQNIIQLIICSFIIALIHTFHNYFGWTWQNITPGLFFVSFLFGVHSNIFTNIQNKYILSNKV